MSTTANQMKMAIGKRGRWHGINNGLVINVDVIDVKEAYGQVRFLVKPVSGTGLAWVANTSVTFQEAPEFSLAEIDTYPH